MCISECRRFARSAGLLAGRPDSHGVFAPSTSRAMHWRLHLGMGRCVHGVDLQVRDLLRGRISRMQLLAADARRECVRSGAIHALCWQFHDEHEYDGTSADVRRSVLLVLVRVCVGVRQDGLRRVSVPNAAVRRQRSRRSRIHGMRANYHDHDDNNNDQHDQHDDNEYNNDARRPVLLCPDRLHSLAQS